jgi:predicted  nucleic acid-binding Zn-ribbon protein
MRHLPGGVDQYLELRSKQGSKGQTVTESHRSEDRAEKNAVNSKGRIKLTGAELRNAQKELGSVSRRLEKATTQIAAIHDRFAAHDQSDFTGLGNLQAELKSLEDSMQELEVRWLELSEALEA